MASSKSRAFHVPAGDAVQTLAEFARQSGEQLVYLVDNVQGERTVRIDGTYRVADALQRMLASTRLTVHRDGSSGAMIVVRRADLPVKVAPPAPPPMATGPPGPEIVRLPEFTVSSTPVDRYRASDAVSAVRVRANLLDTPSSISVMTRDVIDDLAPTRLFDVTRFIAGIEEGRGTQFADRQIIRGFESNGRTVDNFFQSGADNFDEATIDRIEVSKGPNAILAPAGVPGGSINVITKSPQFTRRRTITALAGEFDAQKLTADLTGPFGRNGALAYRLIAAAQDSRRYWADDARLRGKVLAPMLTWQATPHTQFTVKLIAAEHWVFREPGLILDPSVGEATGTPTLAPGFSYRSRNGMQPWSHVGTRTADVFALLTSSLGDHMAVRVAANARYYHEDSMQEFFATPSLKNRYNPYTGELTQDQTWALDGNGTTYVATLAPLFDPTAIPVRADNQQTVTTTTNLHADLAARHQFGGVSTQTVTGLAVSHYDNVGELRTGTLPPIDLTRPGARANATWADAFYGDQHSKLNSLDLYANQRLSFAHERVQLTGGVLRYQVFHQSEERSGTPPAVSVLDDSRLLWLASVLVKPAPSLSLYYTHSTNSTPVIANDLPLWRDGVQDEFGAKAEFFKERLSLTLARFSIRQTRVVVPNPDHQTDLSAPWQLISDLRDHGFEVELTGGLTTNLSVIATYTQLHLRDSLGRRVRAVADRNSALLLNYRFQLNPHLRWSVFGGATYAGERPGDTPTVDFTPLGVPTRHSFMIPAYVTTNAGLSCRHGNWLLRLTIDNFLDERNRLRPAGGRVSGTGLSTAPGRNLRLSTSVDF
ncbi:TonB-dependent receptor [Opitutus sp. ER46]|nr:TonB-dependent receptor [Opitutus sp. ER46]